jgi:hypothetical protein
MYNGKNSNNGKKENKGKSQSTTYKKVLINFPFWFICKKKKEESNTYNIDKCTRYTKRKLI